MTCGSVKRNTENHQKKSRLESASVHLTSRASFIAFLSGQKTKKEALHKSALAFEVAVAPNLGLVIPVYSRQTGFSSASINFYEKPMVETEPTGCKENMAAKGPAKGDRAKMLDALLTRKYQSASIKCFTSGDFRIFSQGHWSRKIFHFISLSTFAPVRKRVGKAL